MYKIELGNFVITYLLFNVGPWLGPADSPPPIGLAHSCILPVQGFAHDGNETAVNAAVNMDGSQDYSCFEDDALVDLWTPRKVRAQVMDS